MELTLLESLIREQAVIFLTQCSSDKSEIFLLDIISFFHSFYKNLHTVLFYLLSHGERLYKMKFVRSREAETCVD